MAPSPQGLTNSWHGSDPRLVKRAKPGLGLEYRTWFLAED